MTNSLNHEALDVITNEAAYAGALVGTMLAA
jgi:hypothetical protein